MFCSETARLGLIGGAEGGAGRTWLQWRMAEHGVEHGVECGMIPLPNGCFALIKEASKLLQPSRRMFQ